MLHLTPDKSHPVFIHFLHGRRAVWMRSWSPGLPSPLGSHTGPSPGHRARRWIQDSQSPPTWQVHRNNRVIHHNWSIGDRHRESCRFITTAQPKDLGLIKSLHWTVCQHEEGKSTLWKGCKTIQQARQLVSKQYYQFTQLKHEQLTKICLLKKRGPFLF